MNKQTNNKDLWETPPDIKIYEALGCIGDGRVHIEGDRAEVDSSGNRKKYTVLFDPSTGAIMTNDNGSYWQGYLGYPSIAYLCMIDVIQYDPYVADLLKGIDWKSINVEFKNKYDLVIKYILEEKLHSQEERELVVRDIVNISAQIEKLQPLKLGKRMKPPKKG